MKIGDKVYVQGWVDEIRKDTVIIRNTGGYFGTVAEEIVPSAQSERMRGRWIDEVRDDDHCVYCSECRDEYIENDLQLAGWVKHYFKYCPNCGTRMDENVD